MSVSLQTEQFISQYRKELYEIYPYFPSDIKYTCIHDIIECEKIWRHFNPFPKNIYQDWEYIKIFYETYNYTPHFYTAFVWDTPVACIPLEWVPERERLEMFGNRSYGHYLFSKDTYDFTLSLLFQSIPFPIHSESIICENPNHLDILSPVDSTYILDLHDISDGKQYIEKKYLLKKRSKIWKEMRNIEALNITIENGKDSDLEWFFINNQRIFWKDSAYHDIRRQENIRLLHQKKEIPSFIRTFRLNWEIVAVRFLIKDPYTDCLYAVNGATEKSIPNLGKFVILDYINLGISLWCKLVDLSSTSFWYKENWTTTTYPVYDFKK